MATPRQLNRSDALKHAAAVERTYANASRTLARAIQDRLERMADKGLDPVAPDWLMRQQANLDYLTRLARQVTDDLRAGADTAVLSALTDAYDTGSNAAARSLSAVVDPPVGPLEGATVETAAIGSAARTSTRAVDALARDITGRLEDGPHRMILRSTLDAYRRAQGDAVALRLSGAWTAKQATAMATRDLRERGISGFTDKAGRKWSLEAYSRMAIRTGTQRAYLTGAVDRLEERGISLVRVSSSSTSCDRCGPWSGRVVTTGDQPATYKGAVVPTLADAEADGLFHPNCRHSIAAVPNFETRANLTADEQAEYDRLFGGQAATQATPAPSAPKPVTAAAAPAVDAQTAAVATSRTPAGKPWAAPPDAATRQQIQSDFEHIFSDAAAAGYDVKVVVKEAEPGVWGAQVTGHVGSKQAFVAYRLIYPEKGMIDHDYFQVSIFHQGKGIATKAAARAFDMYRERGMNVVKVHANIDVGGYTWAAQGFDFDRSIGFARVRAQVENLLIRVMEEIPVTDAATEAEWKVVSDMMKAAKGVDDLPTPAMIADIGRRKGAKMWPGKQGMLGSSWLGELRL